MFEDIIKPIPEEDRNCTTCLHYVEGVDLPGNLKTIDICRVKGTEFHSGEICGGCKEYEQRPWYNIE